MSQKSFPKDLLEQAESLANKEPKRPKQASLRRSVSTAYYAVFHLLSAEGSELLAPNTDKATRHLIQRWFDHGEMKKTCQKFLSSPLNSPLKELIGQTASVDLRRVALHFITLQDARHSADYDMSWNLTRSQTLLFLQQAKDANEAWLRIRKNPEANIFILAVFLWKYLDRPR
jgi:uncharacterized protein (UPF0332 family)